MIETALFGIVFLTVPCPSLGIIVHSKNLEKNYDFSDPIPSPPTLKFLDDIKNERAEKRQNRRRDRVARFVDHGKNETDGVNGNNEYDGSNEYVSFFDDFENSLLKQDDDHYYYEEEPQKRVVEPSTSTTTTTTASTIRPSQTTSTIDDWQPLFRGSVGQGFGDWIGGVNNRFPVSYADVQPEFMIPVKVDGLNEIQYVQAKSSSQPEEKTQKKVQTVPKSERRENQDGHELPLSSISLHPNSIADVLKPISRIIYKNQRSLTTSPVGGDPFSLYPTRSFISHIQGSEDPQQRQKRFNPDFFTGRWIAQRRNGSARNRRNAFTNANSGFNNGIRRPDNFYAPDLDLNSPREDSADLPFEARDSDGDGGIQGPEDFYSQGGQNQDSNPNYNNEYGPRPAYPNNQVGNPYSSYESESPPPPDDDPQYPHPEAGPPSGIGGEGDDSFEGQPLAPRDRPGREEPEEDFFDHDFRPLRKPHGPDMAKPRTFFEDFRGFYTSSNDLEEEDSPPQRGRGRQRRPPANFEDDDAGFGNEDPPSSYNRTPRLPPPHSHPGRPEDDYEDGPPQYDQGQRNNQYNDETPPNYDDDYADGPPSSPPSPVYSRNRYGGNHHHHHHHHNDNYKKPSGRGQRHKFADDPDGDPGYNGYQGRGGGSKPWYSSGNQQRALAGRPAGLNYGYFKRRSTNNLFSPGGLFG